MIRKTKEAMLVMKRGFLSRKNLWMLSARFGILRNPIKCLIFGGIMLKQKEVRRQNEFIQQIGARR
ncbi:MAG: hypothetical protein PHS12_02200 [Candidatus Omnitrophica bacterium]|nr:hypothetical protein [Candidatus Omnitrophota bacterium]